MQIIDFYCCVIIVENIRHDLNKKNFVDSLYLYVVIVANIFTLILKITKDNGIEYICQSQREMKNKINWSELFIFHEFDDVEWKK